MTSSSSAGGARCWRSWVDAISHPHIDSVPCKNRTDCATSHDESNSTLSGPTRPHRVRRKKCITYQYYYKHTKQIDTPVVLPTAQKSKHYRTYNTRQSFLIPFNYLKHERSLCHRI